MATVVQMHATGSWSLDVGYWAEEFDPIGEFHPLIYTSRIDDGRWTQVTGVLLPWAGRALYAWFGLAGLLVLPVAGSVLAALAGRSLALGLGSASGWPAFWAVGLGTPMLFYAGDFWEHSLAVGLVMAALALAIPLHLVLAADPRVITRGSAARTRWGRVLAAGALLGLAAAVRTEMLVFGVVLGLASLFWRRRPLTTIAGAVAAAAVFGTNLAIESAVLPASGATRASGHLAAAGSEPLDRLRDFGLTTIGLYPDTSSAALVAGALAAGGLLALGLLARGRRSVVLRALAAAGVTLVAVRIAQGPGFVPGLLPAAPMAAAAIGVRDRTGRLIALACCVAVALVVLVAWQGHLVAQWGGRLLLLAGVVLTVIGAVALERVGWRQPAAMVLLGVTAFVAITAGFWHGQRTRAYAAAIATIEEAPGGTIIVSRIPHLGREAGAFWGDHRWLRADTASRLRAASRVASRSGATRMHVVADGDAGPPPAVLGVWRAVDRRSIALLDGELVLYRYRR